MQVRPMTYGCCLAIAALSAGAGSAGQTDTGDSELQALRRQVTELQRKIEDANDAHEAQIRDLKEQIDALRHNASEPAPPADGSPSNRPGRVPQSFNPDISAIGDVLFHSGKNEEGENESQFQLRELELAFGAAVDPYGRADFFIGIHQEGSEWHTHVEEGYFTFDTLPYDLKARAGQFYSAFGKANQYHTHAMPWVDKPLVIRNYFGEEGMSEPGAELSWLVPNPWDSYIELTGELQSNRNPESFAGDDGRELMCVTHLKNFFDLGSDASLELGGSFAGGDNAATEDGHWTNLEGVDVTCKWRPAQQGLYRSLTWMSELLLSQKDQGTEGTVDSYGWYSSLEYQFGRRWSTFGRYDYSQFPDDDDSHENAVSAGLTFAQSEYAFWRIQFTHAEGEGTSALSSRNELFLQLDFGIGPHRAHQY